VYLYGGATSKVCHQGYVIEVGFVGVGGVVIVIDKPTINGA
jgi:hypothetical protein